MASSTQISAQSQASMLPPKLLFQVTGINIRPVERIQEIFLEADKVCNDVQHYVTELLEYLRADLENSLVHSGGAILFFVSLDVTYSTQWEKFLNEIKYDPEEDDETYTLRSGHIFVGDRDELMQKIVQALIQLYEANDVYDCTERCLQAKSINNAYCRVFMYGG